MEVEFTVPQTEFALNEEPYPLFVAGFGAGKSTAMCSLILRDTMLFPKAKVGAYAPTYDLLSLITIPYVCEFLEESYIPFDLNKSRNIIKFGIKNQIIFRSLDNPARIVGYETFRAHADELDTLEAAKAEKSWNKIIARNRQKIWVGEKIDENLQRNMVSAYTTPEGFVFCYDRWVKKVAKGYVMFKAPTYSNPHLPPDYIDNLRASYPPELVEAYIEGNFVNMVGGSVYYFDRVKHHTDRTWTPGEKISIGMDFNVNNMNAVVFVQDSNGPSSAVDELCGLKDTPDMIEAIKNKYVDLDIGGLRPYQITIYPDASGAATSSKSASESDITLLKAAGFRIRKNNKNPVIKNRVIAVNSSLHSGILSININKCEELTDALTQQVYDRTGKPAKHVDDNIDDLNDALGYYTFKEHPVIRRGGHELKLGGL